MLNSRCENNINDENFRGLIEVHERQLTIPDPKYFRIDTTLLEHYENILRERAESTCGCKSAHVLIGYYRERVNSACVKVVGMHLDLYIQEFTSEDRSNIPVNVQDVVRYYMRMIAECQEHGFYETYIPTVLTMIYFGKVFSTHPHVSNQPKINGNEINSMENYLDIIQNVSSKCPGTFTLRPSALPRSDDNLVTMFDPRILIMDAELFLESDRIEHSMKQNLMGNIVYDSEREAAVHAVIDAAKELIDYS